jgi:hypothetical protein
MMRGKLIELHARRGVLIAQAAGERERVAAYLVTADAVGGWVGAAVHAAAQARRYPLLLALGAGFIVALRPGRALSWLMKGWSLYQLVKRGTALWERFAPLADRARR